jgi:CRP-like cAMP-binding protein
VIVFEDDPGDALFLVAAGRVKVVLIAEDGREVILSVLGEGSFFGEMAVIDEEPRSAHVIAMEDSSLLVLRREDFHARLRHSPEVAISLLKEISRRLRRADEKIGSLVLLDVNGRVAHLLLRMAEDEGGDHITRKLTHHTIAQMIGSSRETVSRRFSMVDDGWLRKQVYTGQSGGQPAYCAMTSQAGCLDPTDPTKAAVGSTWIVHGERVVVGAGGVTIEHVGAAPQAYGLVYVNQEGTVTTLDPDRSLRLRPVRQPCWNSILGGRVSILG